MFNVRAGLAIGAAAVLITAGALVAAHRPEPAPAPGSAITSAEISQADGITVSMTDQIADSDTCSFSAGAAAEHCGGFLDSPSGGTQRGAGSFTGTMTATVQVDDTDGLTTPATGAGPWNETVTEASSSVTADGVPSDLGVAFGDGACGLISARSDEAYQGSTTDGSYAVTGLQAVLDDDGTVADLALAVQDTDQQPQERTRETDTLLSAEHPDKPGCAAGTSYTVDFDHDQGATDYAAGAPAELHEPPSIGPGLTGWTIDPTGAWTPDSGGVLAEKRITVSTPEPAPDSGSITNSYLFQVVTGRCSVDQDPGWAPSVAAACGLTADPGGPYTATRVEQVTLDGSHSRAAGPNAPITSYQWTWKPGAGCPPAYPLAPPPAASTQRTLAIRVLCGLRVTLTVTDKDGHHANADTTVTVQPRGGSFTETKASYSADLSGKDERLPPGQPEIGNNTGTFSLNVAGCPGTSAVPADDQAVFCPYVPIAAGRNHSGNGYEVAVLHDPNGPFDGTAYIKTAQLSIRRLGIFNGAILEGAKPSPGAKVDFYAENKSVVLDFLTALNEHEGDGDGRPGTGHTEVMAAAAGTDEYNVNKWLEASIRSTSAQLGDDAEVELAADEKELFRLSRDPLVPVWQGTLELWNPRTMKWTSDKCTVGPTRTCE